MQSIDRIVHKERMSYLSKLYALYTTKATDELFLGQAYLTTKDLEAIEQSFLGELKTEYLITLTDGDEVNIQTIDSIEEISVEED